MTITPSATLLNAISVSNDTRLNQNIQDALKSARDTARQGDRAGANSFAALQAGQTTRLAAPDNAAKVADQGASKNRFNVDEQFRREAVDPGRRAHLPGLGSIVDILV